MSRRLDLYCLCLATLFSTIIGCGKEAPKYKIVEVSGKVIQNNKPVVGVNVYFYPSAKAPGSSGATNDKGEFVLMCTENRKGAVVGEHKVTLSCPTMTSMSVADQKKDMPPPKMVPCTLPRKVLNLAETPLVYTVDEKGSSIEIKLPDK